FGPVLQIFLKGRLKVWAGGDRITGIVHVDDLTEAMILAAERGHRGEHYIISAGEISTRDMFQYIGQSTGIPAPFEAPEPLVRLLGTVLDPVGRLFHWQPPLSQERVHYIYDRCVRVNAAKARSQLGWNPRSVEATLQDLLPKVPVKPEAELNG
ncbi:MAG: epimerase, partial [Acaryochloridaceae cyanobacterium RU_4_10]|nr:epimerase [Acaryochloridaceae cyanobacterium RU_4_10]